MSEVSLAADSHARTPRTPGKLVAACLPPSRRAATRHDSALALRGVATTGPTPACALAGTPWSWPCRCSRRWCRLERAARRQRRSPHRRLAEGRMVRYVVTSLRARTVEARSAYAGPYWGCAIAHSVETVGRV